MVGVDDLLGSPQREPVGRHEDGRAIGLQHARRLGDSSLGIGDVLDRLDRDHGGEARVVEWQRPHVRHDRVPLLALEGLRVDVDSHRLPRGQPVVAVADAAAEIENPSGAQERLAEDVGGDVALPCRVESAGRG